MRNAEFPKSESTAAFAGTVEVDRSRLEAALTRATTELLSARNADGHWVGELSGSALSTATAVVALTIVQRQSEIGNRKSAISRGLAWLAQNVNTDGGWGDTVQSLSNLSTTALCWAAFGVVPGADEKSLNILTRAERWLADKVGIPHSAFCIPHSTLVPAIINRYGKDRTFSVPILTTLALAGRLGGGRDAWRWVLPLPFELAACPHQWFAALRLPVVSYALPALIAIGQARHFHRPSRNPIVRLLRSLTRKRTLKVLTEIQPGSGGFLEATPLTSFVVMSLAGSCQANHPVTKRSVEFLLAAQRADGSWPIDSNLATWVTTLAANALTSVPEAASGKLETLNLKNETRVCDWLLNQQYRVEHPYTHAAPGGWAWTDLPGGVPDADDTAGALLALFRMRKTEGEKRDEEIRVAAHAGVCWLLDLQNRDGGIPTFCRGWGALPFDRSSADLTAHAIRAWLAWRKELPPHLQKRVEAANRRAVAFLARAQRADGSWIPLWFGNQFAPAKENPTYGTARVMRALAELSACGVSDVDSLLAKGTRWLLAVQHDDGSWGGAPGVTASVEETALAVEALAGIIPLIQRIDANDKLASVPSAVSRGTNWLIGRVESGEWLRPAPIGFYFAKLWYYERLYPQIFTVDALGKVANISNSLGGN